MSLGKSLLILVLAACLVALCACSSTPAPSAAPLGDPSRYQKPVPAHYPTPR